MKKIILLLVIIFISFLSCQVYILTEDTIDNDTYNDAIFKAKFQEAGILYYSLEFDTLDNYAKIGFYILSHVTYKLNSDHFNTPEETLSTGYGDCKDFALLFANIAYYGMGIKMNIIAIDYDNYKTIVNGGFVNHAIVEYNNQQIEPQNGTIKNERIIGFTYSFDTVYLNK